MKKLTKLAFIALLLLTNTTFTSACDAPKEDEADKLVCYTKIVRGVKTKVCKKKSEMGGCQLTPLAPKTASPFLGGSLNE